MSYDFYVYGNLWAAGYRTCLKLFRTLLGSLDVELSKFRLALLKRDMSLPKKQARTYHPSFVMQSFKACGVFLCDLLTKFPWCESEFYMFAVVMTICLSWFHVILTVSLRLLTCFFSSPGTKCQGELRDTSMSVKHRVSCVVHLASSTSSHFRHNFGPIFITLAKNVCLDNTLNPVPYGLDRVKK